MKEREREIYRRSSVLHRVMAGGPIILPADPWERSDVTVEKLQSLVDAGLLRPITDPDEPEWIAPGNESEPRPRDGYVVSFVVFHERGLGSPVDSFIRALRPVAARPGAEADTPEARVSEERAVCPMSSTVEVERATVGATPLSPRRVEEVPGSDGGQLAPVDTEAAPLPPPPPLQRRLAVSKRLHPRSR